jgi:hypothetical protein
MQHVAEFLGSADVLRKIEKAYPTGDEKVSPAFLKSVFGTLEQLIVSSASVDPNLHLRLSEFYRRCRKGINAAKLHRGISELLRLIELEPHLHSSDSTVSRLERQLRELRMMISEQPPDITTKFQDLQQQVAAIREDIEDGRPSLADKQEDMLQKFLASQKRAFIILPFQRDFDNVWFGAIKPACVECHYAPLRVDEVNLSSLITEDIERYSGMAGVVVVDLTGNNPNVMFELGWSLAKNKKPIVICQGEQSSKVAFDVRGIRHISYENSWLGIETLKGKLKDFVTATDKQTPNKKTKAKKAQSERPTPEAK